jgi:phosphoglycolate phosphatase-like HAD superfamily hydrolase
MNSLQSKTAVMVGDRIEDLEAGQAANVLTIGLAQSVFSKSDLELAGATWTFDKIAHINPALPEIIERLSAEG